MHHLVFSPLRRLTAAIFVTGALATGAHADTLTTWDITGTVEATNPGPVVNYSTAFTASQISHGPNMQIVNPSLSTTPGNTWRFNYNNTPNPIPLYGATNMVVGGVTRAGAIAYGDYLTFSTVIEAGYDVQVDGVKNLYIGKTAGAPSYAGLFYTTDDGTIWQQAGGTISLPSQLGVTDYSSTVNAILNSSPADFDNSTGLTPLTVTWDLAFWNGGIGRIGLGNDSNGGGSLLTFDGTVTAAPEPSTLALVALGAGALLKLRRRK